jgi:hypothetical protein
LSSVYIVISWQKDNCLQFGSWCYRMWWHEKRWVHCLCSVWMDSRFPRYPIQKQH